MTRAKPKRGEKRRAFQDALSAGLLTINWYCRHHAWTVFLVAGGRGVCKACNDDRNAITNPKTKHRYHTDAEYREFRGEQIRNALAARLEIPGQREELNRYHRQRHTAKSQTDSRYIGQKREYAAAVRWRKKGTNLAKGYSERTLPAWNDLEKNALQKLYEPIEHDRLFERDHLIPRNHKRVTGLHCWANVVTVLKKWNRWKGSRFDVAYDSNRWHRSANRHPGGAFDSHPTPEEWKLIRKLWIEEGVPLEDSLKTLRDCLDKLARAYEDYLRATFDLEISADPAWYGCRVAPEGKPLGPSSLSFEDKPDEETVNAFMTMLKEQPHK